MRKDGKAIAFVNIFIYDYATSSPLGWKLKFWINMFLRAFIEDSVNLSAAKTRQFYQPWTYALFGFLQKVGHILPNGFALRVFTGFNEHFLTGKKQYLIRSNDGFKGMHDKLLASVMEQYELLPFEGKMLMASTGGQTILAVGYGDDYMTPKKSRMLKFRCMIR